MKKYLLFFSLLVVTQLILAQKPVTVQINHLLNNEVFENNKTIQNDLGNDYMIDRLQYYISNFSIVHDGGQIIEVEDSYYLIDLMNSTDPTQIALGSYDIDVLEGVNFYFGLDEDANHDDPSLWPADHPLAPKYPSMHWGWTAGYRFLVLEGMSGSNIDKELQFHCVGDEFYYQLEFPVSISGDDAYIVEVDAEYNNLVSGIDISEGVIIHGSTGAIKGIVGNVETIVFSTSSVINTEDAEIVRKFDVFPNPSKNGNVQINIDVSDEDFSLKIYDSVGQVIQDVSKEKVNSIDLLNSGLYYFVIMNIEGAAIATRKVIIE